MRPHINRVQSTTTPNTAPTDSPSSAADQNPQRTPPRDVDRLESAATRSTTNTGAASEFDPRAALNPYKPGAHSGALGRPLTHSRSMQHQVESPELSAVFDGDTVKELDRIMQKPAAATSAEIDSVFGALDTPERVSAFMGEYFRWVDNHDSPLDIHGPSEMLQKARGVCRDQHVFAAYALERAGIEAHAVGYGSPDVAHAITTFRDPNGGWGVIEYGHVHHVNAETELEALTSVIPAAFKFWVYGEPDPDRPGSVASSVYETEAGVELKSFMHATDATAQSGALSVTDDSASLNGQKGKVELELKRWQGGDPMLKDAAGAAIRAHVHPNVSIGAGVVAIPGGYAYSVGPRERQSKPRTMAFIGGNAQVELGTAQPHESLTLTADMDARAGAALGFDQALEFDSGIPALSHLDVTVRGSAEWEPTAGVRLWAAAIGYLPLGDIGAHLLTGGDLLDAPVTVTGAAGAEVERGPLSASVRAQLPLRVRTNLFATEPRVSARASYDLGGVAVGAGATGGSTGLDSAFLELSHQGVSLRGGVRRALGGRADPTVQATVDVAGLARRISGD